MGKEKLILDRRIEEALRNLAPPYQKSYMSDCSTSSTTATLFSFLTGISRDNVIPIPMLEKMIRERLVIDRFPAQVIVALHGQFRRNADGGMKWVFEPIIFREVDAVPTPREILVPNCGVDDADGTFIDKSVELSALPQNVIVWFFVNGRHIFRPDVFLEDDFPAFSSPFRVCPFRVFSGDNFLRFVNDALSGTRRSRGTSHSA